MVDMIRATLCIFISIILCGIIMNLCGGCKRQEPSKLTIVVEGRELSDAEVIIDEKSAGRLTQTIIMPDGKIYIDGILVAKGHHQNHVRQGDTYSGCTGSLDLSSGKHTIILRKKEIQPLTFVVSTLPGHHLLTYFPEKDLVKWDNTSFQVGPGRKVTIAPE